MPTRPKVHKIAERIDTSDRIRDKDVLDVLRLLQATGTTNLTGRLHPLLSHELSAAVTTEAIGHLAELFVGMDAAGVAMAVRAAGPGTAPDTIAASLNALVSDLLAEL